MEAGRELDRLVGEKVMGLRFDRLLLLHPPGYPWNLPDYSTDIAAAWEVIGHLGNFHSLEKVIGGGWRANFWQESGHAQAETAPLAICLAALQAIGAEIPA